MMMAILCDYLFTKKKNVDLVPKLEETETETFARKKMSMHFLATPHNYLQISNAQTFMCVTIKRTGDLVQEHSIKEKKGQIFKSEASRIQRERAGNNHIAYVSRVFVILGVQIIFWAFK